MSALIGEHIFMRIYEADSIPTIADWLPTRNYSFRIKRIRVWWGAYPGAKLDQAVTIYTLNQPDAGNLVVTTSMDRYADPNGPHAEVTDFGRNYVRIEALGGLRLSYYCGPAALGTPLTTHVVVTIWSTL